MYIYIYIHTHTHICTYIYIYTHTQGEEYSTKQDALLHSCTPRIQTGCTKQTKGGTKHIQRGYKTSTTGEPDTNKRGIRHQ